MKAKITEVIEREIEIQSVIIEIQPLYIGDGDEYDIPPDFPLLTDGTWNATVNIDTGEIAEWPKGDKRNLFAYIDYGTYTLIDDKGEEVARFSEYIPHGLIPGSGGDHIQLEIGFSGFITNWYKNPDISEFKNIRGIE